MEKKGFVYLAKDGRFISTKYGRTGPLAESRVFESPTYPDLGSADKDHFAMAVLVNYNLVRKFTHPAEVGTGIIFMMPNGEWVKEFRVSEGDFHPHKLTSDMQEAHMIILPSQCSPLEHFFDTSPTIVNFKDCAPFYITHVAKDIKIKVQQ